MPKKPNKTAVPCSTCSKLLVRRPSRINLNGNNYCNAECAVRGRTRPLADRFWEKVQKGPDCWLWQGATSRRGYGEIQRGSRGEGPVEVHRIVWELTNGAIPAGMEVCHRCDVPACVRVDHLFLGTHADNMGDMARKGRHWIVKRKALSEHR